MPSSLLRFPWHWLPPLLTLSIVLALHRDVPYHDQWDLLPLLDALYRGELQFADLLVPHNGHVLLLPYCVMLALAWLTHWNTLAEVLFGFTCMLGCWRLLECLAKDLQGRPLLSTERLLVSLVVFSLSQAQNWLWGWQLQIPLAMLCITAGLAALQRLQHPAIATGVGLLCSLLATASFAGSLPLWPAALPLVWRHGRWAIAAWLATGTAIIAGYIHLVTPDTPAPTGIHWLGANELVRHAGNTFTLLGALVARFDPRSAELAGLAGGLLYLGALRSYPQQRPLLLALLGFSAATALLVSLNRAGLGDEQMLASRYATLTVPFWAIAVILIMPGPTVQQHGASLGRKACAVGLLLCLFTSSLFSWQELGQLQRRLLKGAAAMDNIDSPQAQQQIAVINPRQDRAQAVQEVLLLRQYQLSHFRDR